MRSQLHSIQPVFLVADIKQAAEYNRDVLCFGQDVEAGKLLP